MKSVYDASTGIEAHMIKNLLHFNDIESDVFGEHLQGGVGDLQAIGIVRVMVADDDYLQAQKTVNEWESSQPSLESDTEYSKNKRGSFGSSLLGFIVGAAAILLLTQTNVESDGIDYDGDGEMEERWEYVNNVIRTVEIDQNRDSKADVIYRHDLRGNIKSFEHDSNFDGRYERKCQFIEGNTTNCLIDDDGDGFDEYREHYKHGVLATIYIYDPVSRKLKKKQYFETQRLKRAEIDLDGDGKLETSYEYDVFEEFATNQK